jgi:hypothetical protein
LFVGRASGDAVQVAVKIPDHCGGSEVVSGRWAVWRFSVFSFQFSVFSFQLAVFEHEHEHEHEFFCGAFARYYIELRGNSFAGGWWGLEGAVVGCLRTRCRDNRRRRGLSRQLGSREAAKTRRETHEGSGQFSVFSVQFSVFGG